MVDTPGEAVAVPLAVELHKVAPALLGIVDIVEHLDHLDDTSEFGECAGEVPECRFARGKRYPLNTVLALAVAPRLAGYRGVTAFSQFAALLTQDQLEAVDAFWRPSKKRYTAPAITTFHKILTALPPETLDNAIGRWTSQHSTAHAPLAMDGKDLRGASKQTEHGHRMTVAAPEHGSGVVLA